MVLDDQVKHVPVRSAAKYGFEDSDFAGDPGSFGIYPDGRPAPRSLVAEQRMVSQLHS